MSKIKRPVMLHSGILFIKILSAVAVINCNNLI